MKFWLITDTHFGHNKMMEYCSRPEGFELKIIFELNKHVQEDDVLIHLGDVCIGNDEIWGATIAAIPGKHWLIKGNHDKKSNSWYLNHGWDFVGNAISLRLFGKNILLSHEPKKVDEKIDFNIHGHFHNHLPRLMEKKWVVPDEETRNKDVLNILTRKHLLLSIENTNYLPVNLEHFITLEGEYSQIRKNET